MATRFLTLSEALALYVLAMERTDSVPQPPISLDALASALSRPQATSYYEQADLIAQAARLAVGISRAQALLDGNKRLAIAVMATHLELNGQPFWGDSLEGAHILADIADPAGGDREADERFEAWLRQQVT